MSPPLGGASVPPELELFVMQRHCFIIKVKQDRMDEYKDRHAAVWPEMLQALSDAGWRNYSLFLRGDGLLVGYFETEDIEAARAAMSKSEVNTRWQADMAPFFEKLDNRGPDGSPLTFEEVFHLE
jgi:L-rhamnose mutarotase